MSKGSNVLCGKDYCQCDGVYLFSECKNLYTRHDNSDDIEARLFENEKKFLITQKPLANYVILNPSENEEIPQVVGFYENNKIRKLTDFEINKAAMQGWIIRPNSFRNSDSVLPESNSPELQCSSFCNPPDIIKKFTYDNTMKLNCMSNFAPSVQQTSTCTSHNAEDKIFVKPTSTCTSHNAEDKIFIKSSTIKFGADSLGETICMKYNGEVSTSNSGAKMEKKSGVDSDREQSSRLQSNLSEFESRKVKEHKREKTSNQKVSELLREKSLAAEKRLQEGAKALFKNYTKMIEDYIDASEKKGIVAWEMYFDFVMRSHARELFIKEGFKVSIHLNSCDVMETKVCYCKPLGPKYNNCFTVISWK